MKKANISEKIVINEFIILGNAIEQFWISLNNDEVFFSRKKL